MTMLQGPPPELPKEPTKPGFSSAALALIDETEYGIAINVDGIGPTVLDELIGFMRSRVELLMIETADDCKIANTYYASLKAMEPKVGSLWDDDISAAYKLHKSMVAKRTKYLGSTEALRKGVKAKIGQWEDAQAAIRRKLELELGEKARLEEQARLVAEAATLETQGEVVEAFKVLEEAETVKAPAVKLPDTKPAGGPSFRYIYSCAVDDLDALIDAVLAGRQQRSCLLPAMTVLNAKARAEQDSFKVPGCRLVKEKV